MEIQEWTLDKFIEYARNPRKNDHAVSHIAAAIKEFGFRVPILAKSDGLIVDGHLRLKAARKLGMRTVPVVIADDMTDTQVKAFRISVNRMAELANWDTELLALEIEDLRLDGFDIELTGFDADALEAMFEDWSDTDDAKTSGNTEPKQKLSDRFLLPPFSVLNARDGWWQDRKRAWLALGIKSELGRGDDAAPGGGWSMGTRRTQ